MMVITGDYTSYYLLEDDDYRLIRKIKSHIPNKICRGGQSQNRIQRLRDEAELKYVRKVSEEAKNIYKNIKEMVILGCANKKNLVYNNLEIKDKVKGILTISCNETIEELVILSLKQLEETKEQSPWIQRFLEDIATDTNKAVYGDKEVQNCLLSGQLEVIILMEKDKKIEQLAKEMGCEVVYSDKLKNYGKMVGMRWFSYVE